MRAIILAAGRGSRLHFYTKRIPKCLLKIGSFSILERQILALQKYNIRDIVVVGGYKIEKIKRVLEKTNIKIIHNLIYDKTNSIFSLWLAKKYLNTNVLILNSDVVFDPTILKELLAVKRNICLISEKKKCDKEAYKISIGKNKLVLNMGKNLLKKNTFGEYIGLLKVSQKKINEIKISLDKFIYLGRVKTWFETAFLDLIKKNEKIYTLETRGKYWTEIDYKKDLIKARDYFKNKGGINDCIYKKIN